MTLYLAPLVAWNTPHNPAIHSINDFEVFSATISERRDTFIVSTSFSVVRRNPGIAGIADMPGRYFVLSEKAYGDDYAVELCRGRLTALPTDLGAVTCTCEYLCLPPDDEEVLKAAADLLRVGEVDYDPEAAESVLAPAEMYDPLFFDNEASDDPTTVLLARRNLWYWDRKTLTVSLIHMTDSETTHVINLALKDSLSFKVTNPPKNVSKLRIVIPFTQTAKGKQIYNRTLTFGSYSYQDFMSAIPKPGDPIGADSGWTFYAFAATETTSIDSLYVQASSAHYGDAAGGHLYMRPHNISVDWRAAYDYQQPREEIIDIVMPAAVQPVLGDLKTETVETLTVGQLNLDHTTPEWEYEDPDTLVITHYLVGDRVQANGRCYVCMTAHDAQDPFKYNSQIDPTIILWDLTTKSAAISDMRTPRIADINRGKRLTRYGIRRLDRIVCIRGMAAETTVEVKGLSRDMSCAHNARIEHGQLPGGETVGPISELEIRIDGASRTTRITTLSGIGDGSVPAVSGEGQFTAGGVVYTPSYGRLSVPIDAYSLGGLAPYVNTAINVAADQETAANLASFGDLDPLAGAGSIPTQLHIGFTSLREEDLLRRRIAIACNPVSIPRGVNISPSA